MMETLILVTILHENTPYFFIFPSLKPLRGDCHDAAPDYKDLLCYLETKCTHCTKCHLLYLKANI